MKDIIVRSNWGMEINFQHEKQVYVFVDDMSGANTQVDGVKVLYLCEPNEISGLVQAAIINHKAFDYILTHEERVLEECDNAVLFEFGGCWVRNYDFPKKDFSVSTIVGFKRMAEGHKLRHDLWKRQDRVTVPKQFYISGNDPQHLRMPAFGENPVLGNDKTPMFNSMFHIVIENCKKNNWFTEKLIDALQTKTLPIYWGCPNIGDWFNTDGFIIVNDLEDLIEELNKITPELYEEKMSIIEENYEISKNFLNLSDRVADKLKNIL